MFQNGPQLSNELTGVYRQTIENSGMYTPIKRQLIKSHQIVPSKNCNSQQFNQSPSIRNDYKKNNVVAPYINNTTTTTKCKSSVSLPLIKNQMHVDDYYYYRDRPRTPPEKRYSATFGTRVPEKKSIHVKSRPSSNSFIYENVHADDYYYLNKPRDDYRHYDVKVGNCPKPEFSRMYIQENFD